MVTASTPFRETPPSKLEDFKTELASLLNRYSVENGSNTPDFILAQYMTTCLAAFNAATRRREQWYGRAPEDASSPPSDVQRG